MYDRDWYHCVKILVVMCHDAQKRIKAKVLYIHIYDVSMALVPFDCLQKCLVKELNYFDLVHITCDVLATEYGSNTCC